MEREALSTTVGRVEDFVGVALLAQEQLPPQREFLLDGIGTDQRVEVGLVAARFRTGDKSGSDTWPP